MKWYSEIRARKKITYLIWVREAVEMSMIVTRPIACYGRGTIIDRSMAAASQIWVGYFFTGPKVIGRYNADLVVEKKVIVELKCCESLVREHQAQVFNYLRVSGLPIGLLVNFRHRKGP